MATHVAQPTWSKLFGDALLACAKIAAVPVFFVMAWLGLQWGARQEWIGQIVSGTIGVGAMLFIVGCVVGVAFKR